MGGHSKMDLHLEFNWMYVAINIWDMGEAIEQLQTTALMIWEFASR